VQLYIIGIYRRSGERGERKVGAGRKEKGGAEKMGRKEV